MTFPLAPYSGTINDLEPWILYTYSAAPLYDRGSWNSMLSPAQFEAAYPAKFFLDLEDSGPKLLIADDTTAAACHCKKPSRISMIL